jgi:trigger factor
VGLVTKRPMEADFFNEVFPGQDLKDEAAFRDALKADLKKYWDSRSKNQLYDQLYHFLLDNTTMEFPESFLKKWLQTSGEQAKTEEQVESEFPVFKNQLKWTLITDKLMKDNNIDVSHEELRNHMRNEVMGYFGGMMVGNDMSWLDSYIDRMMKDQKQVESTYHRVMTEKLFAALADKSNPVKKTVSAEQLADMEHHHEH